MAHSEPSQSQRLIKLRKDIEHWAAELGFSALGVTDTDLALSEARLQEWLANDYHGSMHYMQRHGVKRSRPAALLPGTVRVISVRMDYLTDTQADACALLDHPSKAYISRYALGRDYHKLMRKRLARLAATIREQAEDQQFRAFVDSAPVLEKPLANKAGLGWIGKHTNLINKDNGSWFFLGELYTDLPLPVDRPATDHCGSCRACIDVCPTDAIVAPYQLDARKCISYFTIESDDDIPEPLRKPMGNRIYGCDDCQLFCPWNKFAQQSREADFAARNAFDDVALTTLAEWSQASWLERTAGSAIRRIGFVRWQRNLAVALGNAQSTPQVLRALETLINGSNAQVRRHAQWSLAQHDDTPHSQETTPP
ncbi:MAG: tRNA epoxyqueuosine(34) reductase QueG [Pseudomonadota bacterium]